MPPVDAGPPRRRRHRASSSTRTTGGACSSTGARRSATSATWRQRRGHDDAADGRQLDVVAPMAFVPEHGSGFPGRPGAMDSGAGRRAWAPRFVADSVTADDGGLLVESVDEVAALRLHRPTSPARRRHQRRRRAVNEGDDEYCSTTWRSRCRCRAHVAELMTFHGRWTGSSTRPAAVDDGPFLAENRRGRTSHESPPLLCAGTAGFGESSTARCGRPPGLERQLTWSTQRAARRAGYGQLGELLHPGEIAAWPGERHATPPVFAVHSTTGLGPASRQFHAVVRSSPAHRTGRDPSC